MIYGSTEKVSWKQINNIKRKRDQRDINNVIIRLMIY